MSQEHETPIDLTAVETLKPFLREVATTLRILQNRVDELTDRVAKLEQDRLSAPGWYMDEGE